MEEKTRYQRLREAGICTKCKRAPARQGKAMCAECAKKLSERVSEYNKQHKDERNAYYKKRYLNKCIAGICPRCGNPAEEGHTFCRTCIDMYQRRRDDKKMIKEGLKHGG